METVGGARLTAPFVTTPSAREALHRIVSPFNPSQEDWIEYAERLMHHFVANDINVEEKKQAIML